jgi:RNA polymerase primary sigma factor/RNA polymerase sigma factor
LCYRITDYRPESFPNTKFTGAEAGHDLRLLVEDLSDAANVLAQTAGEKVLTVEELSKMFNVSTKTIQRWREQGLVSRRFVFDGRKRVGFLKSSVDRFVARNEDKIRRGSQFSHMTDEERDDILRRARRLSQAGGCAAEVARRIARKTGRSAETVRYTLKQFDAENPDFALFPENTGPLSDDTKRKIFQQYRRGISVEALAKRFCRTRTSIYRIVNEQRYNDLAELPLDYIPNPYFGRATAEATIMAPVPGSDLPQKKPRVPAGLPPYLASLYEVALLTREQEAHLFRKFNYLKYKATKLRDSLNPSAPKASVMDEIEKAYEQAVGVKNEIVRANLRLVVSIAKRHVGHGDNFFELVSDGNISLMRAAEKFDYARGFKFSTYATWAIMKNFARSIPDELRHRDRFRTSSDEMFYATPENRTDPFEQESAQAKREEQIHRILGRLDEREQRIIISRFGLDHSAEPLTLKEVGEELGVTKERVRQIEARALDKLRLAAAEEKIELPEL